MTQVVRGTGTYAVGSHESRALEWYGIVPVRAGRTCPLRTIRGRCTSVTGSCVCNRHRLLDHGCLWTMTDGRLAFTGEPYDLDGESLTRLERDLAPRGLRVTVQPTPSMWSPETLLLVVAPDNGKRGTYLRHPDASPA